MEQYRLSTDITVYFVPASSFPDGVLTAHQALHALVPFTPERKYFGLSRPEAGGDIVYMAAAAELYAGEAAAWELPSLVVRAGNYTSVIVQDYMQDLPAIGEAFRKLLQDPAIDQQGYCVEWYINDKDVRCMVRLQY